MAEKIDPQSTMFFNKEITTYKNSVIAYLKQSKLDAKLSHLEMLLKNKKEIPNEC